jgi:hypothetical protein
MQNYNEDINELKKMDRWFTTAISVVVLILVIGLMCASCVDAVVRTAESDEQEARRRVFVEQSYQRPAAFRKASPTQEEMEHLHGMLRVMEVKNAK